MRYAEVPETLRRRPFTTAQGVAAGLTVASLQSAPWRQVFRGVWVHAAVQDDRATRLAAALLVIPRHGVLCGLTAAWLHGADVRQVDDLDVHVAFPAGGRIRRRTGLVVSQETLGAGDVVVIGGVRLTTPVRTVADCLRLLRGAERLVVADALTNLGRTTVDEVRIHLGAQRRLRNLRVATRLVDAIEPRAESPMETRLRVALVTAGLPRPDAQVTVRTPAGGFVARVDLAYPELRVAIEYDGAWHWNRRREDDRRRQRLQALGWIVLVYSAADLYGHGDAIAAEVADARRRAGLARRV